MQRLSSASTCTFSTVQEPMHFLEGQTNSLTGTAPSQVGSLTNYRFFRPSVGPAKMPGGIGVNTTEITLEYPS